jgi:hypothetical protein
MLCHAGHLRDIRVRLPEILVQDIDLALDLGIGDVLGLSVPDDVDDSRDARDAGSFRDPRTHPVRLGQGFDLGSPGGVGRILVEEPAMLHLCAT